MGALTMPSSIRDKFGSISPLSGGGLLSSMLGKKKKAAPKVAGTVPLDTNLGG
jgi:hypothetical protein